jgi:hypothetical protein
MKKNHLGHFDSQPSLSFLKGKLLFLWLYQHYPIWCPILQKSHEIHQFIYMWYTHHIPILHPNDPTKNLHVFRMKPPWKFRFPATLEASGLSPGPLHRRHRLLHLLQGLPLGFRQRLRHRGRDATWFRPWMVFKRSNMGGFAYQKWRSNTAKMEESWKHGDKTP